MRQVHHPRAHGRVPGSGRPEVEERVGKCLDARVDDEIGADVVGMPEGLHEAHGLCSTLGDVFVLQLLGECERVGLVVVPPALHLVLFHRGRGHHAQPPPRDLAEANMEPIESAAVHEEHAVGCVGAHHSAPVSHELRVEPECEREAPGQVEVGAQYGIHGVESLTQHRASVLRLDVSLDALTAGRERLGPLADPSGFRVQGLGSRPTPPRCSRTRPGRDG
mmetsp:Transcript_844/g.3048  ORF Transcript_844/g.3048 Transcript_844/m.3048 type:complete len:221 (-) Transcript_844:1541-2203(-)